MDVPPPLPATPALRLQAAAVNRYVIRQRAQVSEGTNRHHNLKGRPEFTGTDDAQTINTNIRPRAILLSCDACVYKGRLELDSRF